MKKITNKEIAKRAAEHTHPMTGERYELKDIIDNGRLYEDMYRVARAEQGDMRMGVGTSGVALVDALSIDRCDKISDLIAQANGYEDAYDCIEDLINKGIITK